MASVTEERILHLTLINLESHMWPVAMVLGRTGPTGNSNSGVTEEESHGGQHVWVQHVLQLGCSPSFVKDTGCTGNWRGTWSKL